MKIRWAIHIVALGMVCVAVIAPAPATAVGFYKPAKTYANGLIVAVAERTKKRVMYRPPLRGAPSRRVGGATRGSADVDSVVAVLAPESTGLAGRADPTFYWYSEKPIASAVTFTVIADDAIDPLAELVIEAGAKAGVQALSLSERGVKLQPDVIYEWSVAVVIDAGNRSKDIISVGTVMYREPAARAAGDDLAMYAGYLENGYWYDAVELVVGRLQASAGDAVWRGHYGDLLAQVGLEFVSAEN